MKNVIIFTSPGCSFCKWAKKIFEHHNVALGDPKKFEEVDTSEDNGFNRMSEECPGEGSVPQIFIGGQYIGGIEELRNLVWERKLVDMLA